MKLELKFKPKTEDVYDENANVTFRQNKIQERMVQIDKTIKAIIHGMNPEKNRTAIMDDKEITNINQLAGKDNGDDYVRNCRRIWDRLWKYFGVEDYKKQCFPPGENGLLITPSEKNFITELFEDASFLDGRVKSLENEEKERIQWAATNLYQMIRRRIGITEEIAGAFFEATKDKSYIREQKFDEIDQNIKDARKRALDKSDDDSLNIREKELWTEGLIDDLVKVIEKWNHIYGFMDKLKCNAGNAYHDIINPENLLKDAIKEEKIQLTGQKM